MQAKDIPEEHIINAINHIYDRDGYVSTRKIQDFFDEFPPKVVQAKLRKMEARYTWLEGCACGCGTAWYITASQELHVLQ